MIIKTVHNNKQNQMPENLHLDTKVDPWSLWFCLPLFNVQIGRFLYPPFNLNN